MRVPGYRMYKENVKKTKMKQRSRTEYSIRNTTVAFLAQAAAILMGFFTRVVFTHTLSEGYVGINGLFTDILNILSLSELGVGTAILFALYEPVARHDIKKQQILMQMFGKFYRITAGIVLITGLLLAPWLGVFMKNRPDVEHLLFIYLLYLLNSVLSYLLVYKKNLIDAHQMNYVTILYQNGFLVIQDICQIVILLVTGNFILFLCTAVICTVTANLVLSKKAEKLFPYLKEECNEKLPEEDKKKIYNNIKAMFMHRMGDVVVNNTDNLLISGYVGVISAGIYSNYYLVIGSIRQVLQQAMQGVSASVGNLGALEDGEKVHEIYRKLFFAGQWLFGFAGICLFELLNPFVELAFGRQYLFSQDIVLILCINFFLNGTRRAMIIYKESMGLFWYDRYKAVAEAVLNLVISIVLVQSLGVEGVFLGTLCSTVLTSMWVEPYVLYKHRFHRSPVPFFINYAWNLIVMAGVWWGTHQVCCLVSGGLIVQLAGKLLLCILLPNLFLILVYHKTWEYRQLRAMLVNTLAAKRRKK